MGFYIDPPVLSKEQFLVAHGTHIEEKAVRSFDFKSDSLPVCLIDNGAFTAAGIAYSRDEAQDFLDSFDNGDPRPHVWFLVKKDVLRPYLYGVAVS